MLMYTSMFLQAGKNMDSDEGRGGGGGKKMWKGISNLTMNGAL